MPLFKKTILKTGRYEAPAGSVEVTPDRLKHWADQFATMKRRKLRVPVGWDHSSKLEETIPASFSTANSMVEAKRAAGIVDDFKVSEDGESAEVTLKVSDEAKSKAKDNVVGISPVIHPKWKDGKGREYQDILGHFDLVTKPVDDSQTDFIELEDKQPAKSMSLAYMSTDGPVVYMMTDADMDEDPIEEHEEDNPDLPDTANAESQKKMEAAIALLKEMGIEMVDEAKDSQDLPSFLNSLITGLKTKLAAKKENESEEEEESPDMPDNLTEEKPDFATFSLDEHPDFQKHKKESEAEINRLKKVAMSLDAAHQQREREALTGRLDKLCSQGKCTPKERDDQKGRVESLKLSTDDKGNCEPSEVHRWLESREALPYGCVWSDEEKTKKMALDEEKPDSELIQGEHSKHPSEMTQEELNELDKKLGFAPVEQ